MAKCRWFDSLHRQSRLLGEKKGRFLSPSLTLEEALVVLIMVRPSYTISGNGGGLDLHWKCRSVRKAAASLDYRF
jgi:hypothetical protein